DTGEACRTKVEAPASPHAGKPAPSRCTDERFGKEGVEPGVVEALGLAAQKAAVASQDRQRGIAPRAGGRQHQLDIFAESHGAMLEAHVPQNHALDDLFETQPVTCYGNSLLARLVRHGLVKLPRQR